MLLGLVMVNSLLGVVFFLALTIGVPTVVILAIISLARGPHNGRLPLPSNEDPEQILRIRLARGDISVEEYERLRELIRF